MWIVLAAASLGIWQSGMFFTDKQKPILFVTLLMCTVLFWLIAPPLSLRDPITWGMAAIGAGYLLAFPFAARPSGAQHGLAMLFAALMLFLVGRISAHGRRALHTISMGLAAYTALVVAFGVLMLGKAVPYVDAVISGRMGGFFQYANTFAVFSTMGMLAGLAMALQNDSRWSIWHLLITVNISGVLLSGSRALLILLPILVLVYALFVGRPFLAQIPALLWDALVAVLLQTLLTRALNNPQLPGFWVIPVAAVAWGAAYGGCELIHRIQPKVRLPRMAAYAVAALGVLAVGFVALRGSTGIVHRLASLRLSDPAIIGRIYTLVDGLRIVAAHPLGIGADGWRGTYFAFASYNYIMNAAHSYLVDTAVSGGFLAAAGLVFVWLVIAARAWRRARRSTGESEVGTRILGIGLALAVAVAALHSLVDWDMAFGTFLFIFWYLLGVTDTWAQPVAPARPTSSSRGIALAVCGMFVLSVGVQWTADNHLNQGFALGSNKQYAPAIKELRAAASLDPWNPFTHHNLALAELGGAQPGDPAAAAAAEKEFKSEMQYDRYAYTPRLYYGQFLQNQKRWDEAEQVMAEAVKLGPWRPDTWSNFLAVYVNAAQEAAKKGDNVALASWVKAGRKAVDALHQHIASQPDFTHLAKAMQFDESWPELVQFQQKLKDLGAAVP